MSVRRKTDFRLTLVRCCGTCGQTFITSAESPWMRQIERDGKKQATTYYCSQTCFAASYKHIGFFDGKTEERRKERERNRDVKEKNRRYYLAHAEEIRAKKRAYYAAHPGLSTENSRYRRKKKKLLAMEQLNQVFAPTSKIGGIDETFL